MREEQFEYYLEHITEGGAFFRLAEASDEILPRLENAFACEPCPDRRRAITEIIWQHRTPASVPFPARALNDPAETVWKEALDGLVTIGGTVVLDAMRETLKEADSVKRDWINEAIEQMARHL